MPGEEANIFKARYLHGRLGVYAADISVKVGGITRGGLPICLVLPLSRGAGMGRQKSAEGIVGPATGLKART